jgi:GMP synthase-like glutamine amidotransferase
MSRAIILQHADYHTPGRIVPILRDYGIPTDVRRVYKGDEVPTDLDQMRLLIVLGGPMSVADVGSDKFPFLAAEVELLKRLVTHDRSTLGIGLGAQLLAHAAGAKVYPAVKPGATPQDPSTPTPEFGWGPVTFPFPGGTEPMVMGLIDGMPMFHWHFDTFDLPKLPPPANAPPPPAPPPPSGNSLLSSTRTCRNQAFRFRNRLFGFQYHFELTAEGIEQLVAAEKEACIKVLGSDGPDRIKADTAKNYPRYSRLGDRLIRNFVQFLKVS